MSHAPHHALVCALSQWKLNIYKSELHAITKLSVNNRRQRFRLKLWTQWMAFREGGCRGRCQRCGRNAPNCHTEMSADGNLKMTWLPWMGVMKSDYPRHFNGWGARSSRIVEPRCWWPRSECSISINGLMIISLGCCQVCSRSLFNSTNHELTFYLSFAHIGCILFEMKLNW